MDVQKVMLSICPLSLRTTVPLVSYIIVTMLASGTPSDFGIMSALVPVVKILKKIGVTGKIWRKRGLGLNF